MKVLDEKKQVHVYSTSSSLHQLRPDGKTQITCEYKKGEDGAMVPQRVHTILISTQHSPDVSIDQQKKDIMEHVIKPIVPAKYL